MTKATMSIDPTLIRMLGRKLYSSDTIPIVVRELLQNSVDACERKGVVPQISIEVIKKDKEITITCTDNGCGMDEQELLNDFLCLGGSSKRGTDSTGKFGIAKAAIMSGNFWSVHTLDNYIDTFDLENGNDIQKVGLWEGTCVTVRVDSTYEHNYLSDMLGMVYLSDVDVHFKYDDGTGFIIEDKHAGLKAELIEFAGGVDWMGYGIKDTPIFNRGITLDQKIYVRLNGLVQYRIFQSNMPDGIYFIDVANVACDPSSDKYPFTMSRESLVGDMKLESALWIRELVNNPLTTANTLTQTVIDESIIPGRLCKGTRNFQLRPPRQEIEDWTNGIKEQVNKNRWLQDNAKQFVDNSRNNVLMKLYNYAETSDYIINKDAKILQVWHAILAMILPDDFEFALGLITSTFTRASYERTEGISFFAINPDEISQLETKQAQVMRLWISACHEAAHLSRDSHDEIFVATMSELMEDTTVQILSMLPKLSKELKW